MNSETKTCNACCIEKPVNEFGFRTQNGKPYPRTYCKPCRAAEVRGRRAAKPDQYREKENAARRKWNAENPGVEAAKKARYRENQPGMVEAKRVKSKLRHKGAMPEWANKKAMAAFYAVATARRAGGEDVTVDHVIPLNHDLVCGLHNEFNLQYLTRAENVAKSNTFLTI